MEITDLVNYWATQYEHERELEEYTEEALVDLFGQDLLEGLEDI